MEPRDKALRAQEIQTGFQGLSQMPASVDAQVDATLLTGMAARLATHIRGADVFEEEDVPRLKCVANALGIQSALLPRVLRVLEHADLAQVQMSAGGTLKLVRESVPAYGDLYARIGDVYEASDQTEVESALVATFDAVVESPKSDDGDLPIAQLDRKHRAQILDVADQAGLIRVVRSRQMDTAVYYSPQYWEENPDKLSQVISRYGNERVSAVIRKVRDRQGLSVTTQSSEAADYEVLRQLTDLGMLPSPTVRGWKGEVAFAFTPFSRGVANDPVHMKVMEKTRAILACVRYGQEFATITSIRSPVALLCRLRERLQLGPHSEIFHQYRLLIEQGIARISRSRQFSDRFFLHFIDTPENRVALAAAIDLLEAGVPLSATHVEQDIRSYAMNGDYDEPLTARARKRYSPSNEAFAAMQAEVIEILVTE